MLGNYVNDELLHIWGGASSWCENFTDYRNKSISNLCTPSDFYVKIRILFIMKFLCCHLCVCLAMIKIGPNKQKSFLKKIYIYIIQ